MTTVILYSSGLLKKICNLQLEFKIVTEKKKKDAAILHQRR